jgi:three-Cys-motif partner protein
VAKPRDNFFEGEFEPHTRLKHLIWDRYHKAWAQKLLGWGRAGQRLWIVDAFAGSGRDEVGNPGSPVIAATIARDIVAARLAKPASMAVVHVLAIEKDPRRCEELRTNLGEFTSGSPPIAYVREGTLADLIDRVIGHIGDEPALFFLDPFGVDGMQADLLPKIFSGPQNELFALFSDTGAARLHAVLDAEDISADEAVARGMTGPSLFPEFDAEDEAKIRAEAERRAKALGYTRPAAKRILDEAFGGESWLDAIEAVPPEERPLQFVRLYMQLLLRAGANFGIAIPVRDKKNRRVYHLVYASKSAQGFRTMKEAITAALGASNLPAHVRDEMVLDLNVDVASVVEHIAQAFDGQTVRWTDSKSRHAKTVRNYALEHTGIFPPQCDEIRDALTDRYKTGGTARNPQLTFSRAVGVPRHGGG